MKILIAEDNPVAAKLLESTINSLGECKVVETGVSASNAYNLALESGKPYDLIFLDISMPFMSGFDVLKEIRDVENQKGISQEKRAVIVMVTATRDKHMVQKCIKKGCNGYIAKPIEKKTIFKQLESAGITIEAD